MPHTALASFQTALSRCLIGFFGAVSILIAAGLMGAAYCAGVFMLTVQRSDRGIVLFGVRLHMAAMGSLLACATLLLAFPRIL